MEVDRPGPGEELNPGAATRPREAATVIVLRGGAETLEVLLVKRNPEQRFMGGAWVFPGGAVDRGEDHRVAGAREVAEEAGVVIGDPGALVEFSRWITPRQVKIRFDTRFYLAPAPDDARPRPDGAETVDLGWFTPRGALEAYRREEIALVFPTIKTLEQLAPFESAERLLEWARGREVVAIEPQVVVEGEVARVVLPGEPGDAPWGSGARRRGSSTAAALPRGRCRCPWCWRRRSGARATRARRGRRQGRRSSRRSVRWRAVPRWRSPPGWPRSPRRSSRCPSAPGSWGRPWATRACAGCSPTAPPPAASPWRASTSRTPRRCSAPARAPRWCGWRRP